MTKITTFNFERGYTNLKTRLKKTKHMQRKPISWPFKWCNAWQQVSQLNVFTKRKIGEISPALTRTHMGLHLPRVISSTKLRSCGISPTRGLSQMELHSRMWTTPGSWKWRKWNDSMWWILQYATQQMKIHVIFF